MDESRRIFLKRSLRHMALGSLVFSGIDALAAAPSGSPKKHRLRIAIASDGHYGQSGTNYETNHENIIKWLNQEHDKSPLDFVLFNGDLVHDRPRKLAELKSTYLSRLEMPYYATHGNHDHASDDLWQEIFGHSLNCSFEQNKVAFILANTSDSKGRYLCPDQNFLKASLDKHSHLKAIFLFMHIPPHKWVPENTFYNECTDILDMFSKYPKIKALFHGHDHNQDSVFFTGKNLPHFFDAHYGGSWGTEYFGYRILEIADNYSVHTYQVNASGSPILSSHKF